ncbi:hypothetical protein CAAN1_01S04368 [[Candida] anglica]|uniref:Protein kinase domain-containing protein n=1 Tax=[Candida] anglica TaxID=148631 RepID=A0ABP0EMZ5_9ASCO
MSFFQTNRFTARSRRKIGSGISASVELCESKTRGFLFVVKTYHGKEVQESKKEYHERVLEEYMVLSKLSHPNIVEVYKYKISLTGSIVSVYMEAGLTDFRQLMKSKSKFDIETLLSFWFQLCDAIKYLHYTVNLCHRDLKLDNLILCDHVLKVIDFGAATSTKELAVGLVGTEAYVSPEMYSSIRYDGMKADIWSIGILLYYFLMGKFPWKLANHSDKDFENRPTFLLTKEECITQGLKHDQTSFLLLLQDMLESNPSKRISILDFSRYKWFETGPESILSTNPESYPVPKS